MSARKMSFFAHICFFCRPYASKKKTSTKTKDKRQWITFFVRCALAFACEKFSSIPFHRNPLKKKDRTRETSTSLNFCSCLDEACMDLRQLLCNRPRASAPKPDCTALLCAIQTLHPTDSRSRATIRRPACIPSLHDAHSPGSMRSRSPSPTLASPNDLQARHGCTYFRPSDNRSLGAILAFQDALRMPQRRT